MKTRQLLVGLILALVTVAASAQQRNGYNGHNHSYSNRSYQGNYHRGGNWGGNGWSYAGAAIAGALIGGAIANSYAQPYYAPAPVYVEPPVYVQPNGHYERVYVPSCNCYQTVLIQN